MTIRLRSVWLRTLLVLALLAVALFGAPQAARADWLIRGDTIPADEVVDNDVIITGSNVRVDGTVNGDVVAIGSSVTVNGTVQGSLVAVGRTVSINGQVGGSVYVAARTLKLGPSSFVHNNVHFGGLLLDSQRGSKIGRDLVVTSVRAIIGSEIGRGLNAMIALLSFNGQIGYGLDKVPETPTPSSTPSGVRGLPDEPSSVLLFVGRGGQKIDGHASPALATLFQDEADDEGMILPEWLVARMGEFTTLLLVGGLALWLVPTLFRRWVGRLRAKPLPAVGYGVLEMIIFVNAIWIAVLLAVMLVAAGIWLGNVTLWELAFLFWGIGFSLLMLALSLLALAVFYGSKVIVAYLAASLILERLARRAVEYRFGVLLLGLVLYVLLRSIPTIGWVIEVIVVVLGLGAIWLAFLAKGEPAPQAATESE